MGEGLGLQTFPCDEVLVGPNTLSVSIGGGMKQNLELPLWPA